MVRRLAIYKRLPLDFVEGWDDKAWVDCTPIILGELSSLTTLKSASQNEQLNDMVELVRKHVLRGKVYVVAESGENELADLEAGHVNDFPVEAIEAVQRPDRRRSA